MVQTATCIRVQGQDEVIVQGRDTKVEVILQQGVMPVLEIGIHIRTDMPGHMTDMTVSQSRVTEVHRFPPDDIGKIGTTIVTMIMKLGTPEIIVEVNTETEIGMLILKNTVMMKDIAIKVIGQKVTGQGQGHKVKDQGQVVLAEGEDSKTLTNKYFSLREICHQGS